MWREEMENNFALPRFAILELAIKNVTYFGVDYKRGKKSTHLGKERFRAHIFCVWKDESRNKKENKNDGKMKVGEKWMYELRKKERKTSEREKKENV